ncbi:uncharacterized protein I303_100706 [Kwoniella dejecticola CBS 10117]|uniref:Uncharacterized protein n=1 Tax=Kwoniella dejecticola CBS 10117 TaxID=1296121 RepID=A0A1A6AFQ6_9TREE|nr:uncharacterized protein I303_00709 [Kwoniella dejecticola CBS 10117]OBR88891.1 hypothetical protein I303_00709 [Kwoniella dejecticola CBS 10117]
MIPNSSTISPFAASAPHSPEQSPRASMSSSGCSGCPPLTPIDELDRMSSGLIISTEEVNDEAGEVLLPSKQSSPNDVRRSSKVNLPNLAVPPPAFGNYSFGASSPSASSSTSSIGRTPSPLSSTDDVALPSEGFKFGTCPTDSFVGTPTAEQGPFEYPIPPSGSSSSGFSASPPIGSPTLARRGSLALGMTHRRESIIASHPPPISSASHSLSLSPPPTRRSSTCSTITTLPVAGRRPSIVHSATVEVNLPQTHSSVPPFEEAPQPQPSSASSSRRPSVLMFPAKPLPAPIPPSLLARRGSLPAAQLFGLPSSDQPHRTRASYSNASGSNTISTASLYLRRQSVVSESGFSNGSGATIIDHTGASEENFNGIRRPSMRARTPSSDFSALPSLSQRRGSLSFFPPISAQSQSQSQSQMQMQSPIRSSSISSRSSIASSSSHRSSTSSRVPINFSPRHPNYAHTYGTGPSRQSSITTTTSSTSSVPSSPKVGYIIKRNRKSITEASYSSASSNQSNPGLSSSEEENEHEHDHDQEEELPTPNTGKLGYHGGQVPSAPTFSDPWSTDLSLSHKHDATTTLLDNKMGEMTLIEDKSLFVPLETPPLETVLERPPLETVDSGATERP